MRCLVAHSGRGRLCADRMMASQDAHQQVVLVRAGVRYFSLHDFARFSVAMDGDKLSQEELCEKLPKIELHAHLNGSLSAATLTELGCLNTSIEEYQKLVANASESTCTLANCMELFKLAQNATSTAKNVYIAAKNVIKEFYDDNVVYLELRTTPRSEPGMTRVEYIEAVVKAIQENPNEIIVKLILAIDRRHSLETSKDSLSTIIEMKNTYPDVIKGVDLCGDPVKGVFSEELFTTARNNGLFVTLHCAEVLNNDEVQKMLMFKPDRLGHGTHLHPDHGGSWENWQLYQKLQIPIECCLTSTLACGITKSVHEHHVRQFITHQIPFCIATDDKGVFCTTLSNEYKMLLNVFQVDINFICDLIINSIEYIFADNNEKQYVNNLITDKINQLKHRI